MEIIKKYFGNLSPVQYEQLHCLKDLYADWNTKINVISRKDMDDFYERHVLHSLSIAKIMDMDNGSRVVDIGTGGGFPGIPLAILFPNTQFVLMDSIGKKIKVVQAVQEAVALKNVEVVCGRVEEWRGGKFDLAVTRAVASLDKLTKWAVKVLKQDNQGLIALKGGDLKAEIEEAHVKTRIWPVSDYFDEPFFETKCISWSEVQISFPPLPAKSELHKKKK